MRNTLNMPHVPLVAAAVLSLASPLSLAEQYVFPAQGQSAEQQKADEYDCHQWASDRVGYDPIKAASETKTTTRTVDAGPAPGSGASGALRGAAKGALIAGIADGDAGKGAAVGAVGGGIRGRATSRSTATVVEQTSAQDPAKHAEYLKARSACLEGKGYTVK
jgi:hypothetical protein